MNGARDKLIFLFPNADLFHNASSHGDLRRHDKSATQDDVLPCLHAAFKNPGLFLPSVTFHI